MSQSHHNVARVTAGVQATAKRPLSQNPSIPPNFSAVDRVLSLDSAAMPAKQALPRSSPARGPSLSGSGPAPSAATAQSKAVFKRLAHHLKAGAAHDADLVAAAVRAAQQSGWPSAASLRELTSQLVSAASSCCAALRALDPAAPRGDLESSLANTLSLLCHTLRAATVLSAVAMICMLWQEEKLVC